jgi:hypothetical protein
MYFIQHCFICRLSDPTVSEDTEMETVIMIHVSQVLFSRSRSPSRTHDFFAFKHSKVDI